MLYNCALPQGGAYRLAQGMQAAQKPAITRLVVGLNASLSEAQARGFLGLMARIRELQHPAWRAARVAVQAEELSLGEQ